MKKALKDNFRNMSKRLCKIRRSTKVYFVLSGLASTLWVLWRVITKPSRATYPCVQAASPVASGFILYLAGIAGSFLSFKLTGKFARQARYSLAILFLLIAIISGFFAVQTGSEPVLANLSNTYVVNDPIGEPKGIFSGRVVWAHNAGATNENWTRSSSQNYFTNQHTNIDTVESMINAAILALTGESTLDQAWESLFVHFNEQKKNASRGYLAGEKIFIKTNFVTASSQTFKGGPTWTTPQAILVILRHLINEMSILQENIAVGDPMNCFIEAYWDILHSEFPNVKYVDYLGGNGRTFAQKGTQADIFYSDRGEILRDAEGSWSTPPSSGNPVYSDTLYKVIEDADYMINIAALKGHHRAGVTLCAKNHFGSHVRPVAAQLHMGLPHPSGSRIYPDEFTRPGYSAYRIHVDLMGHRLLGGNTMLFMVDGLWAGPDAGARPVKFQMAPFNNDWGSSILMSQDQVALESVCLDFLQAEFQDGPPQMPGVDDYLRQAADTTEWPDNFVYDPENDGSPVSSLGVHEHWNNAINKQYSHELGNEYGIDFIKLTKDNLTSVVSPFDETIRPNQLSLSQNYPNPFNPTTTIKYTLNKPSHVVLRIYNLAGQELETLVNSSQAEGEYKVVWQPKGLPSGVYFYRLQAGEFSEAKKTVLQK